MPNAPELNRHREFRKTKRDNPAKSLLDRTGLRTSPLPYDALLVVGFGGPEKMADVLPFLENVLSGRNVPRERMLEVAAHYEHFDGKSPLNDQMQDLVVKLRAELTAHSIDLPIYWGNRNWHPLLADTLRDMASHGVKRALAYVLRRIHRSRGADVQATLRGPRES